MQEPSSVWDIEGTLSSMDRIISFLSSWFQSLNLFNMSKKAWPVSRNTIWMSNLFFLFCGASGTLLLELHIKELYIPHILSLNILFALSTSTASFWETYFPIKQSASGMHQIDTLSMHCYFNYRSWILHFSSVHFNLNTCFL